jgi:hypothetical protein
MIYLVLFCKLLIMNESVCAFGRQGRKFKSSHPDQFFFIEIASCDLFDVSNHQLLSHCRNIA